jgi:integrase
MRNLTWGQVELLKKTITVGDSKTDAGTGRTIPIQNELRRLFVERGRWFQRKFSVRFIPKGWYVFPWGRVGHLNPTKPVTTFKTAWKRARKNASIKVRFHDMRHTAITNLLEGGNPDETVMQIAGHVSRQMLTHYSHLRMEAKRKAMQALDRKRGHDAA